MKEGENDPVLSNRVMWQTVISSLNEVIDRRDLSGLQKTMDMVRRELPYENPGFFNNRIAQTADELEQMGTNLWLINQLNYIISLNDFTLLYKDVLLFQNDIIKAALLRDQYYFQDLMKRYLGYSFLLLDNIGFSSRNVNTPIICEWFHLKDITLSHIEPNTKFEEIRLTDRNQINLCLKFNIEVLTIGISLNGNVNQEIYWKCFEIAINLCDIGNTELKFVSLNLLTKLLSLELPFSIAMLDQGLKLIYGLTKGIPKWYCEGHSGTLELTDINIAIHNFIGKCNNINLSGLETYTSLRYIIKIYKNLIALKDNDELKHLVVDFCKKISYNVRERFTDNTIEKELLQLFAEPESPYICSVLEHFIQLEIKHSRNKSIRLEILSPIWKEVINHCFENVTKGNGKHLSVVLQMVKTLNYWFRKHHIDLHDSVNKECKYCDKISLADINTNLKFWSSNMTIDHLISIMESNVSISNVLSYVTICALLLTLPDIEDLNDEQQCNLIKIATVFYQTGSHTLSSESKNQFPNIYNKSMEILKRTSIENLIKTKYIIWETMSKIPFNMLMFNSKIMIIAYYEFVVNNSDEMVPSLVKYEYLYSLLNFYVMYNILGDCLNLEFIKVLDNMNILSNLKQFLNFCKHYICVSIGEEFEIYDTLTGDHLDFIVNCNKCNQNQILPERYSLRRKMQSSNNSIDIHSLFGKYLDSDNDILVSVLIRIVPHLLNHMQSKKQFRIENFSNKWLQLHTSKSIKVQHSICETYSEFISVAMLFYADEFQKKKFLSQCFYQLVELVKDCLAITNNDYQKRIVEILRKFAMNTELGEENLMNCFQLYLCFLIRVESTVTSIATINMIEICNVHNCTPFQLFNWYRRRILKTIVDLTISIYLKYNVRFIDAVTSTSKMIGYKGPRDFIISNYKLIISILISYCVKYDKADALLKDVCCIIQMDVSEALSSAFLVLFPYIHVETNNMVDQCLNFVKTRTDRSIVELLKADIKSTIAEILVYYNQHPSCVLTVFQFLIKKDETSITLADVGTYISSRFLGILTHFNQISITKTEEKYIQKNSLLSLGDIIRFMGTTSITPFRFKIVANLKSSLAIALENKDKELVNICTQIWHIFIKTVDIHTLGSMLSTVFVSLEPLQETHADEVNSIYRYLVVNNGNILSAHINDLFFLDRTNVSNEIKEHITKIQNPKMTSNSSFINLLKFYLKQINHENISVRIYGLEFLTNILRNHRNELNLIIIDQGDKKPLIEELLALLLTCCNHHDENLRFAASKCLGELGAIEPSYLSPNYTPQLNLSLTIHSDSFAIMALAELCMAYQLQRDTKYIDGFSLAIQDILLEREVCLKTKCRMEVWEAIPSHMRQLMESLFTSCYTRVERKSSLNDIHPIFNSSVCTTSTAWATNWAFKLIENIEHEKTMKLLSSFKPSIKRDKNILSKFFPYILIHAIQSSSDENVKKIIEEVESVIHANTDRQTDFNNSEAQNDRTRSIKTIYFASSLFGHSQREIENDVPIKCAKFLFHQFDFIGHWIQQWQHSMNDLNDQSYLAIHYFLNKFNRLDLSIASYNCGEYARALYYLDSYIEENQSTLQSQLSFMAKIYAELVEVDQMEGAISLKSKNPTIQEQILVYDATNRLQESLVCYESLLQMNQIINPRSMIQCYLGLDQPETALLVAKGFLSNHVSFDIENTELLEECCEPLWRMGRFDELNEMMFSHKELAKRNSWGVGCAKILMNFKKEQIKECCKEITSSRNGSLERMQCLSDGKNIYIQAYPEILKLHMITEIEMFVVIVEKIRKLDCTKDSAIILNTFLSDLNSRLDILQSTARNLEPILNLRRSLLNELHTIVSKKFHARNVELCAELNAIKKLIGQYWIRSTDLACKAGFYPQAQAYILNAEAYGAKSLFFEKAKLQWKRGLHSDALNTLEKGVQGLQNLRDTVRLNDDEIELYTEAKLLLTSFNAETMNVTFDQNQKHFHDMITINPQCERYLVRFAEYLECVYNKLPEQQRQNQTGKELLHNMMGNYGKSMTFGCNFIYQSMPRFLSIWFDLTSDKKKDEGTVKVISKVNSLAQKYGNEIPVFMFYTAFSQLISRICHPSNEVFVILKTILVSLIFNFPQQSFWQLLVILKSSYPNRVIRCHELLAHKSLSTVSLKKLFHDFNMLADKLIYLTNKPVPTSSSNYKISEVVKELPGLFTSSSFSQIILPLEKLLQARLPPVRIRNQPATSFNAFPIDFLCIEGIADKFVVLQSLQKPKRIRLLATDGKQYDIMLKPKDDLRRDFRLMEFNGVVKRYLYQDQDARLRRLNIRTYAVVPLNEDCGLLEWVPNLQGLRTIIINIYKKMRINMSATELRSFVIRQKVDDTIENKRKIFLKELLPRHPPVFGQWFTSHFTNPHNWYQARNSYITSTAVYSIVGYILGLGDRHGENILLDATTGKTVHVDFNCLFNKGETLDFPEVVPFRLTHNMLHAMGPIGAEGLFRKCCEITLRVLQENSPTLMSVLRPFIYDHLMNWKGSHKNDLSTERTDATAMANVKRIESRLKGIIRTNGKCSTIPLSVEGVVRHCINEAIDTDNLAKMYYGWGAFL